MTIYNDNDPKACAWLRELIRNGLVTDGEVDERSILEITPEELAGRRRVHLFAGIGGWDYALRLAGWPDDREVWTASCPCQPFSNAGARRGVRDERNLWPAVLSLVAERRPATVFGEQVASRAGREWLARVRADLEGIGYAFGAADLCAAGVGAPQIRQRLYWVADRQGVPSWSTSRGVGVPVHEDPWAVCVEQTGRCCSEHHEHKRRAPPGVLLVADGVSANLDAIAGFGNAIVPQVAAKFVRAYMEIER